MNTGLQKHTIKKKLRNRGINPDKIDLEAELDSTLSLPENIQNLEEKYGRLERTGRSAGARQEKAKAQRRNQVKREAESVHEQRPTLNQYIDQTKDAETTYRDPTQRQMEKWKENPNKYDIEGVDTRTNPSQRPQTDLPFQRNRDVLYSGSAGELKKSMRQIPGSISKNATGEKMKEGEKVSRILSNREQLDFKSGLNEADNAWEMDPKRIPDVARKMGKEQSQRPYRLKMKEQFAQRKQISKDKGLLDRESSNSSNGRVLYSGSRDDLKKAFREKPDWPVGNNTGRLKDPENRPMRSQMKMMNLARTPGSSNAPDPTDFYEEDIKKDRRIQRKKEALGFRERMKRSGWLKEYKKPTSPGKKLEADSGSNASEILKDSRNISDVGKNLNGGTTEKSNQQSLRDGFASKGGEKTLDKWEDNYI